MIKQKKKEKNTLVWDNVVVKFEKNSIVKLS